MVDELMLRDVKNILKKLELIRSREDIEQILIDNGLSNASIDEVNEFLVSKFMTNEELILYKKYMLYKRREDLRSLGTAIDSIEELTSSVSLYYEENARCRNTISEINKIIEKIDRALRDYPNIRVSTAYHKVKNDYKRYFDSYIKDGMDRAVFTEEIDEINRSSAILRGLKKRRLKQLREGLDEHNKNSKLHVDTLYEGYIASREEYGTYLREVMSTLMSKNRVLYEAGLLSLKSMYKEDIPTVVLPNGVVAVDQNEVMAVAFEYIASKAFVYFQKIDEPDFDEKMFIKYFREFLLHFYNQELTRLNKESNIALKNVRDAFSKQRNVTRMLGTYQELIEIPRVSLEADAEDTFALVYQNNKTNK